MFVEKRAGKIKYFFQDILENVQIFLLRFIFGGALFIRPLAL